MYKNVVSFIHKLYGTKEMIPLHSPIFNGNEKKYIIETIDSTFVSSIGKFVEKFEDMMMDYTGACKAVACVNGTNALHLALKLVGVEKNDEVITQALTFIATCNAISYIGAHPLFIDVDKSTMGLSPTAMESWLKENAEIKGNICYNKQSGRRIKACVPMHTFGHPVYIEELIDVCDKYHLELVEDAAESLGSFYKNKHIGTFGKIGVISFNGNKTITTGGGGMLLFQDKKHADLAKHLSTQAKTPHKWEFIHDQIGYNYRMPNINAALGCAQLEQIDKIIVNKRTTAKRYKHFFELCDNIDFFIEPDGATSNYWLNAVILEDKVSRDNFLKFTNDFGVMTRPIWELMNRLPMFKDCMHDGLQNTIWFADRVVNIPSGVRKDDE